MQTYSISKLARAFGLSRATLLYYDRIGLLPPSGRSGSGYRIYTAKDHRRLEKICRFRETGLPLAEIRRMTAAGGGPFAAILKRRMNEIGGQIVELKKQQRLLAAMLRRAGEEGSVVDKALWVKLLRKAGMDDAGMARWHAEFERHAPEGHHAFLASLGIAEAEIQNIRQWAEGK
ncbi:MAG: MerR family transcriptional regulator [Chthoniobacteraceae bacterium]|nr:MerR family transcriptional regulator [Chthoniobacteraceae bacterium]